MVDELTAVCSQCGETKPLGDFNKKRGRSSGRDSCCRICSAQQNKEWRERPGNRERQRTNSKTWRLAAKVEGLRHYGGVCVCCGEADVRFLTFDHIDGGGRQHMAEIGTTLIAPWLRKNGYPPGFQVLCFNCNTGRHFNGGICPHQDPEGRIVCAPSELLPGDDT